MNFNCAIIVVISFFAICPNVDAWTGSLIETNRLTADGNLRGNLQIFTDDDGGVYACKVVVTNLSTNDYVLQLSDAPAYNCSILMINQNSNRLDKEFPKLKSFEMHTVEMKLNHASSVEWFYRLSDHLVNPNSISNSTVGALTVSFNCGYRAARVAGEASNLNNAWFRFLVSPVALTSNALSGNAAEKYEKRVRINGK